MSLTRVGNIRIEDVLGQGGMGTVYVGFDETLERRVALKAIRTERRMSPSIKARFLREARVLSQLEHPGICRIHGYVEQDGVDYLVLEFVEGHTLQAHLGGDTLRPSHRLQLAIQIAEALVAAHAKGIVHRDLKPDNVIVTTEGDAKVLDFGLARTVAVERPDDADAKEPGQTPDDGHMETAFESPPTSLPPLDDEMLATEAGTIMGTPLFMSPEQARGEEVTTASDMYSLGLLLQNLWTTETPYPKGITRRELMLRASLGEADTAGGLPAPIARVVQRLRELAPATRATAVETLRALRRYEERPARIFRRCVAAALVLIALAAATKYTIDLRYQKGLAQDAAKEEKRQRELAELRRDGAEGLIGFALDEMAVQLRGVAGSSEWLDGVYAKVQDYYDAFSPADLGTEELWRRVQHYYQYGENLTDRGQLPAAMDAFQHALELGLRLLEQEPRNEEVLVKLGYAHFWMGHGHVEEGDYDAALSEFELSAGVARRLVDLDPENPEHRLELVAEESNIAQILEAQEKFEEAAKIMRESLQSVAELAASDPARDDWQLELANSHILLGRVLESLGDEAEAAAAAEKPADAELDSQAASAYYADAERHYHADRAIMLKLISGDPDHAEWLDRLGTSYSYIGSLLEARGETVQAAEYSAKQQILSERLASGDTENTTLRDHVATSLLNEGRLLSAEGRSEEARVPLERAAEMFMDLSRADPTRARWSFGALNSSYRYALLLEQLEEVEAAVAAGRAGLEFVPVGALAEWDAKDRKTVAQLQLFVGCLLTWLERPDEAGPLLERARDELVAQVDDSADHELRAHLAHARLHLGEEALAAPLLAALDAAEFDERRLESCRERLDAEG